jgi:hypothetical protein
LALFDKHQVTMTRKNGWVYTYATIKNTERTGDVAQW